jgi:ssDNA-binding Zn-finger/Zn-ribbon topoisomerase 1
VSTLNLETCPGYEVVPVGPSGGTKVQCPECSKLYHMTLKNGKLNKQLKVTCKCGGQWNVVFCTRQWYRKYVSLPGSWKNTRGEECGMIVENLSMTGIKFLSSKKADLHLEQPIEVSFVLNNGSLVWINEWVRVVRIEGKSIAAKFINLDVHSQKVIGFYLMN